MKRTLFPLLILFLMPALMSAQVYRFSKSLYAGRVVNATVDSSVVIKFPATGTTGLVLPDEFKNAVPDSMRLVRIAKGDTVKFETARQVKLFSAQNTSPWNYVTTRMDTLTRAAQNSVTDTTVVYRIQSAVGFSDWAEVRFRLQALTGNAVTLAKANYVEMVLEVFYSE